MSTSEQARLRESADRNLVAAFVALIPIANAEGFVRRFGAVTCVVTGVAHPFYNPIFVLDARATAADVGDAIDAARSAGREPSIQVREDVNAPFEAPLSALGFESDDWKTPGMVLDPIPSAVPLPPAGLRIERLRDGHTAADGLEAFHEAMGSGPAFRSALSQTALRDDRLRLLVGYDDGGPVCCAAAIRSEREFGIYAVSTVERARRLGLGTAITWAAIESGRNAWGLATSTLQSSEMGLGVYAKMGFVEVCRYVEYMVPKAPPGAQITPSTDSSRK